MGLWGTIKGWLNIGGVKVKIEDVDPTIYPGSNTLTGKAILTSKGEKEVLSVKCTVINERTEKENGEEQTKTFPLGEQDFLETFTMKEGETREIPFSIDYHLEEKLQNMGGVAGAVGKMGAFAMGKKESYSVKVECDVKGTMMDPSAVLELKVGKKE